MSNDEGTYAVTLRSIAAPDFDLEKTLHSGQVFHWEKAGDGFIGTIEDRPVYVEQRKDVLRVELEGGAPATPGSPALAPPTEAMITRYFALDHPLVEICASFPGDATMREASDFCRGLRIIRQPKWECLAMFICSSMKQVAHIRQISHKLRQRFGQEGMIRSHLVYTFPGAEPLARASERELRGCALGYRAKNLRATAQRIAAGEVDLEQMGSLPDDELRTALCALPGVGAKVANCVMLFAYERLRAFPIDVWIERVLREQYFPGRRKVTPGKLRTFAASYFGRHGGYAQQYLFHHARTRKRAPNTGRARQKPKSGQRSSLHDKKAGLS
jgi:N-glycosylase/DNA lyase